MIFNNKIEAIKALRALGGKPPVLVLNAQAKIEIVPAGIGLKDSKDLIEAAMELGVRQYLADQVRYRNEIADNERNSCWHARPAEDVQF